MFARTLFRSSLRTLPFYSTLLPRSLPRSLPRTKVIAPLPRQPFSQTTQRFRYPPPPPSRGTRTRYEYYPAEVKTAKPLITPEALRAIVRSPRFKWLLVIAAGGGVVFYVSNLETVPVSGRRRFNCYSDASVEAEGLKAYKALLKQLQGTILPSWDPRHRMVSRVMNRLIPASGLENVDWEVHVVDSPSANAFVLPGGKVFVLTGILPITQNDDGLAAILGHEIAHNLARHAAESMSSMVLFAPLRFSLIALDSMGITFGLGHLLASIGMDLGITRPASRKQESEADYIGLMMMARSCYNPDEAVRVWQRMERFQEAQQEEVPEWLSTHPSNSNRVGMMRSWLSKAEEARGESDCAAMVGYSNAFGSAIQNLLLR